MSTSEPVEIVIDESGKMSFLCDDDSLADITALHAGRDPAVRRASHIVPASRTLRVIFMVLRATFGDDGAAARLTRRLPGRWLADMRPSGGPVLGPYALRASALRAERAWLKRNRF